MAQHFAAAKRSSHRSSDWHARQAFLARDIYAAASQDNGNGGITVSGLLIRVVITSVVVAAMLIATNSLMLHWLR